MRPLFTLLLKIIVNYLVLAYYLYIRNSKECYFSLFIIVLYILKLQHLLPATKMTKEDLDINIKLHSKQLMSTDFEKQVAGIHLHLRLRFQGNFEK